MKNISAALLLAILPAFGHGRIDAGSRQEDAFLTAYYSNTVVSCRDYLTANGARLATYQWWLLGFVSGANHANAAAERRTARVDVERILELAGQHCQLRPKDSLASTASAVLADLPREK